MEKIMSYKPCNPKASMEVKNVLDYLYELKNKGIITGQHTQTRVQEELAIIEKTTGKLPALCGFELLSYSPNVAKSSEDEDCMYEIENNRGTLQNVWEWAEKKGLITLTWHWFSPLGGHDKSFFSCNTDFDAELALIEGTKENKAFISDIDYMAGILKEFCEKKIPIIWRPFHEADGTWFWWGAKGCKVAKELYLYMFNRYTKVHNLNNLIWVWNSSDKDNYVGDDYCDVISVDYYVPERTYTDYKEHYENLIKITETDKITALAEIGPILSIEKVQENKVPWAWYMMWSRIFVTTEKFTEKSELKRVYNSDYAVTLDKLPKLY